MNKHLLDIIICIPLAWGTYKGLRKGFVYEIALFMGIVLGIYAGFRFCSFAEERLIKVYHLTGNLVPYISFLLVFIAVLAALIFFAKLLELVLKATALNIFNKLAGGILGLLKFAFVLSVMFYFLVPLNNKIRLVSEEQQRNSILYKPVNNFSLYIIPAMEKYRSRIALFNSLK